MLILTVAITPILTALIFDPSFALGTISPAWFAVIIINSVLPITSTNMFLIPYRVDKKITALSVTWIAIACVPIVALLITIFRTCHI